MPTHDLTDHPEQRLGVLLEDESDSLDWVQVRRY